MAVKRLRYPVVLVLLSGLFFVASFSPSAVLAKAPVIQFDAAPLIGCRDATTPEFSAANPDERLIEVRFQVSALLSRGGEDDLLQFFYTASFLRGDLLAVDYAPKTTLQSELASGIVIEKKKESNKQLGLSVTGRYEPITLANGTGSIGSKKSSSVRYELLPPMDSIAASGTIRRGRGVYFKLRPSSQTTLEGAKEFALVLRGPANWRGGLLTLSCKAIGVSRGVAAPFDETKVCGRDRFDIALYLEGDEQAKATAVGFVHSEEELRQSARDYKREIQRRAYPTPVHKFGALLDVVDPKIPDRWLERILNSNGPPPTSIERRLPGHVRAAAVCYREEKQRLLELAWSDDPSFDNEGRDNKGPGNDQID